ncbi:DUF948 domain-containing protein [Salinicoccus hispanicus]|uniref:DUF948 domain-containing protein n=1 Tax=Salinicoccus hispanicus TaxID=157225 RepID=A0A6N8TX38_9STAP|nr:DUF948 domain-containing protein [Salinicoccus hispanicus]MXQ50508.1 DUF948 domain-containing protein [Salinicoccus hispanicus]
MDWQIILYIAAGVAALAFLILCIAIAIVLFSVKKNLDHVAKTLDGVEGQIQGITRESTDLLHKTNRLAEDVQGKSAKLNSVVDAVQGIGQSMNNLNSSVDRVTNSITHNISQNEEKISQVVQWSNVAMEVADKWQMRQKRNSAFNTKYSTTAESDPENLPVAVNQSVTTTDNLDENRVNAGLDDERNK